MLRVLGFLTLVLVAICLVLGASIALAAPAAVSIENRTIEAVDPDRRMIDESLAAIEDVYELDFTVAPQIEPNPEFDEPSDQLEI